MTTLWESAGSWVARVSACLPFGACGPTNSSQWPPSSRTRTVACFPVGRSAAIAVAVQDVEVAGGQDTMRLPVLVADERGEVRDDPVGVGVGVAKALRGPDARMRPYPSAIHGDGDERVSRTVGWRDAGRRYGPDTADGDLVLLRPRYWTNLLEPLDVDPVREAYHHRPAVEQCVASPAPPLGLPCLSRADVQDAGVLRGRERRVVASRRPVAARPPAGERRRRPSGSAVATARGACRCSNSPLLRPIRPPMVLLHILVWSTPPRGGATLLLEGLGGQIGDKRRNGLTVSSLVEVADHSHGALPEPIGSRKPVGPTTRCRHCTMRFLPVPPPSPRSLRGTPPKGRERTISNSGLRPS